MEPIKFVYTNNKKIGSRLISWATRERGQRVVDTPSHFSIVIHDFVVVESTMANGVTGCLLNDFLARNNVLHAYKPKQDSRLLRDKVKKFSLEKHASKYDLRGALYLGYRELINYYLNKPLPTDNKFQSNNKFFCNEIYQHLTDRNVSMMHPNSLMHLMESDKRFLRTELK